MKSIKSTLLSRGFAVSAIAFLVCAGSGGIAIASFTSSHPGASAGRDIGTHRAAFGRAAAFRVSPLLAKRFAIFSSHKRLVWAHADVARTYATPTIPENVQSLVSDLSSPTDVSYQRQRLDPAQTVEVVQPAGPLWVIPGAAGVCVVSFTPPPTSGPLKGQAGPGASCLRAAYVARQGLISFSSELGDSPQLVGLVPNDCTAVLVTFASGQSESLPVGDNTVIANLPSMPTAVSLKTTDRGIVAAYG